MNIRRGMLAISLRTQEINTFTEHMFTFIDIRHGMLAFSLRTQEINTFTEHMFTFIDITFPLI